MSEHTKACLDMAPRVAEIMGLKNELFGLCFGIWEDEADIVLGHYDGGGGILVAEDSPFWPDTITPLPTLEQCLDWLREKDVIIRLSYQDGLMKENIVIPDEKWNVYQEVFIRGHYFMKKPREAAYRVVIAVGEGGK